MREADAMTSPVLGDLCSMVVDCKNRTPPEARQGEAFAFAIGTPNIVDGRIILTNAKRVDRATFDIWTARAVPQEGDVVLTREAPVGRVGRVSANMHICLGQRTMLLRANHSKADSRFLQYLLLGPTVQHALHSRASGSTVPHLRVDQVRELPLPTLPSVATQQAIGEMLGALDDKISINERVTVTSRSLGYALFTRAITMAKPEVVDVASISSLVVRGGTPTYVDDIDDIDAIVVLNQKCVRDGHVDLNPSRLTLSAKVRADRVLKSGDVLINSTGVGTLGRAAIWSNEITATCDSHITIVRLDSNIVDPLVGGYALLLAQSEIEELGEGSTGQTELSRQKLGRLRLALPPRSGQAGLAAVLDSLERRSHSAAQEIQALIGLRDVLLPRLISGELRIKDAESLVSSAV